MKRLLLIASAIIIALTAAARTDIVTQDGYVLNVVNKEYVEIKKFSDKEYVGDLVVPDSFNISKFNIKLPVTKFHYEAFADCPNLKSIDFRNLGNSKMSDIGLWPTGTTRLDAVHFPEGIESISNFSEMNISKVDIPESVTRLHWAFAYNPIKEIDLKNVTNLFFAFTNCTKLSKVEWPDSLYFIGDSVFYGTALTDIVLNNTLKVLRKRAFGNIQTLLSVKCFVSDPDSIDYGVNADYKPLPGEEWVPIDEIVYFPISFEGSDLSQCILWVPEGSLELYRNYPMWRDFPDIREMDAAGMPIIKDEQVPAETSCFDLQGRKVTDPQPGNVYIVNGRKLLHQE